MRGVQGISRRSIIFVRCFQSAFLASPLFVVVVVFPFSFSICPLKDGIISAVVKITFNLSSASVSHYFKENLYKFKKYINIYLHFHILQSVQFKQRASAV